MNDITRDEHFKQLSERAALHGFTLHFIESYVYGGDVLKIKTPWDSYRIVAKGNWPSRVRQQIEYQASKIKC